MEQLPKELWTIILFWRKKFIKREWRKKWITIRVIWKYFVKKGSIKKSEYGIDYPYRPTLNIGDIAEKSKKRMFLAHGEKFKEIISLSKADTFYHSLYVFVPHKMEGHRSRKLNVSSFLRNRKKTIREILREHSLDRDHSLSRDDKLEWVFEVYTFERRKRMGILEERSSPIV
jgi:hypothetical protein